MPQLPSPETYLDVVVEEDIADMIEDFLQNRRDDQKRLALAIAQHDLEQSRRISHAMKGVGGMYGFHWISAVAAEIEQASQENPTRLPALSAQLEWYLDRVHYRTA